jgi:hypothetical protein
MAGSVVNKSTLGGDESSAVHASSAMNKSSNSVDVKKQVKFEKAADSHGERRELASTLPNINSRHTVSQSKMAMMSQAKTLKKPILRNHGKKTTADKPRTDSILIDELPEDPRSLQFSNLQSKRHQSIRRPP